MITAIHLGLYVLLSISLYVGLMFLIPKDVKLNVAYALPVILDGSWHNWGAGLLALLLIWLWPLWWLVLIVAIVSALVWNIPPV